MLEDGNWLCFVGLVLIPLALWMRSRPGSNASQDFSQPPGQPQYAPRPRSVRPEYQRTPKSDMQYSVVGVIVGAAILLFLMIQIGR